MEEHNMSDCSGLMFPKPSKKSKKSSFGKSKKEKKEKKEDVIVFEAEVDKLIDFYETHRGDMVSVENYRFTKKLKEQASRWILDVMRTQKCDRVEDVILAWQNTVLHAAEKAHPSHKVGSFMNMFWLLKNDSNYIDVMEGKYDRAFGKPAERRGTQAWGDPRDFAGVSRDDGDTVI
jgi:hypothetical protein